MMKSNKREDYQSFGTWLNAVKHERLWRGQLQELKDSDDGDREEKYGFAKERLREVQGGLPADIFYFFDKHPKRVLRSIEELWQFSELSLPWLKLIAVFYLIIEWVENYWDETEY